MICPSHGAQLVSSIALLGPTMTRPELASLPLLDRDERGRLYGADPECDHYVTYRGWDGVMCVRCNGWYCA